MSPVDRVARAMIALFDAPAAGAAVGFALYDERLRYIALSESLASVHGNPVEDSLGRTVRDVPGRSPTSSSRSSAASSSRVSRSSRSS
jgi:hypothetical protein